MKNKIYAICIFVIIAVMVCTLTVTALEIGRNGSSANTVNLAAAPIGDSETRLAAAVSYIYKDASETIIGLPYTTINLTQMAMVKVFSGEPDALSYLNDRVDRSLDSAYEIMDGILDRYKAILDKYEVSSNSSYRNKYKELDTMFTALKSSSNELIKRTRTFINGKNSDNDAYYTAYAEQLSDLSDKIQEYGNKVSDEYSTIMAGILGDDYSVVK